MSGSGWLQGRRILPPHVAPGTPLHELVDETFLAYNAGRLREACILFVSKMLAPETAVGVSLSGALTPAGLGVSCIVPLIEAGMIDWIVSTGANLYHDAHFALDLALHAGSPQLDDRLLREEGVVRIYDIVFSSDVLLHTDHFYKKLLSAAEFQHTMGSAEFHHRVGKYLNGREEKLGLRGSSVLAAAYRAGVPVYTPSPGDSSIGMNMAAVALEGGACRIDPSVDVNETTALVYAATRQGSSAVIILGGGSPKNFVLQTEPQIQEVLGLDDAGHDYFLQITDARPDTGGLSGATPSEAVTWGKVDPGSLPDTVVCYLDTTVALPILTAYALDAHPGRPLKRLYDQRDSMLTALRKAFEDRKRGSHEESGNQEHGT